MKGPPEVHPRSICAQPAARPGPPPASMYRPRCAAACQRTHRRTGSGRRGQGQVLAGFAGMLPGGVGRGLGGRVLTEADPDGLVVSALFGVDQGGQHLAVRGGRLTA
jgi:hypothetical protein